MTSNISQKGARTQLQYYEWLVLASLILLFAGLFLTISRSPKSYSQHDQNYSKKKKIEVMLKGAVKYPGLYQLPDQMTMLDFLNMAEMDPEADLRRYKLDKFIDKSRSISVPKRAMITIEVSGAVHSPGKLQIPKGTSLEQLLDLIVFNDNADLKPLKKKRKVKSNEKIVVRTQKL